MHSVGSGFVHRPLNCALPHPRCDVVQWYDQFLQVSQLDWASIVLRLYLPSASVSLGVMLIMFKTFLLHSVLYLLVS